MSCWDTIAEYGLRSLGIGERLLPRSDFTLCQQFTLIGSGMILTKYESLAGLSDIPAGVRQRARQMVQILKG